MVDGQCTLRRPTHGTMPNGDHVCGLSSKDSLMPQSHHHQHDHHQGPHVENHFTSSEVVRDIVIGMADGLTVPFALAAGLSGAINSSSIVITAGVAEVAAGSIAMGLGGYLAARTDAEHFAAEREREVRETQELPEREFAEVAEILRTYGVTEDNVKTVAESICADQKRWVDFMMRFELGLEEPDPKRAGQSARTIAISYIIGGMVPLSPYLIFSSAKTGLIGSIVVTLIALTVFGYIKGLFTTTRPWKSAVQTVLVGGLAASAAFGIAKWIGE